MPSPQLVSTKEKSPPLRAETIRGGCWFSSQPSSVLGLGRPPETRKRPKRSVVPLASSLPLQLSVTRTEAPATGAPESSEVTQASEAARPHLKWTARSVTKAAAL